MTTLKPRLPKYAFTANAFVKAIEYYGERLFALPGKLIVVENALLEHPDVKDKSTVVDPVAAIITKHWFDIESPATYGLKDEQEWQALERLYDQHPDELYLCIDTLNELAYFNRVYSNDELLNIAELGNHFQ